MFEDLEIINKLKEEKNLNTIARELGISVLDVHKRIMRLKHEGYVLKKNIYDDGNVEYFVKCYPDFFRTNMATLKLCNRFKFSAMLISDTHFENDQIFVKHCIPEYSFETLDKKFVLEGHKHKMAFSLENGLLVNMPTLSNLVLGKHEFPGAIRMDLTLDNDGTINTGRFEQFIFTDKMHTINEITLNVDIDHTHLYEKDIRPKIKSKQSCNGLSQIEKFNQKWNRN